MKRLPFILAVLSLFAVARLYALNIPELDVSAFQSVTVTTSTVVALSTSSYTARKHGGVQGGGTTALNCNVDNFAIRYEVDGASPTVTTGHLVISSSTFTVYGYNAVRALRMIGIAANGASNATVQCDFLGNNNP